MKVLHYKCPRCAINFWVEDTPDHPEDGGDTCPCCELHQDIKNAKPMEIVRHYPEEWS